MDPAEILRGVDVSPAELDLPGATVSHLDAITVMRNAVQRFDNPTLGLELGRRSRITDRGVLGLGLLASPDLASALELMLRFPASAGYLLDVAAQRERRQLVLVADVRFGSLDVANQLVDKLFAGLVSEMRQICEADCAPDLVELRRPPPSNATAYERYFGCAVRFNALANRLCIADTWLHQPLPMANNVTYQLACKLLEQDSERAFGPSSLSQAIAHAIRKRLPEVPTPEEIAEMLHISERSLRRKLAQLNLSYRILLDTVRRDRALDLVINGRRSMAEAAALTGFGDPRSFRRAFARWTGRAPSALRSSLLEHDAQPAVGRNEP